MLESFGVVSSSSRFSSSEKVGGLQGKVSGEFRPSFSVKKVVQRTKGLYVKRLLLGGGFPELYFRAFARINQSLFMRVESILWVE